MLPPPEGGKGVGEGEVYVAAKPRKIFSSLFRQIRAFLSKISIFVVLSKQYIMCFSSYLHIIDTKISSIIPFHIQKVTIFRKKVVENMFQG